MAAMLRRQRLNAKAHAGIFKYTRRNKGVILRAEQNSGNLNAFKKLFGTALFYNIRQHLEIRRRGLCI